MKALHALVSLATAAMAVLAPGAAMAQVKTKPTLAVAKAELFAPRYRATGNFLVVQVQPSEGGHAPVEKVLRIFGAGALAEKQAYSFAATTASGAAPTVVKRVLKHYRCPKRSHDSSGSPSDTDCKAINIGYTPPAADPTDPAVLAECSVTVDADVLYLGRRAKTVKWALDPPSPPISVGSSTPRIRLLDVGSDSSGQEVRGITFSDNTEDPQERGEAPGGTRPVFHSPTTTSNGQEVVWTRATDARRGLAKVFYYAIVLQVWSDTLQDYVFCAPYDPTIGNRGN